VPSRKKKGPGDRPPATLGDLLYRAEESTAPSEAEWQALVQAIAARDQSGLRALFDRMHRVVFTVIVRVVGNAQTAEEVTLDVFHDVWRRASSYDPNVGTVIAWVMNLARSRAIDRLRFEQRKKRAGAAEPAAESQESEEPYRSDEADLLRDALASLSPEERQAIERTYFAERTYAEAAVELNEPLGTVKTRIRSALTKLRSVFASKGRD
jgi:RNA polymerase sigma-70 factor, ECF subfamily